MAQTRNITTKKRIIFKYCDIRLRPNFSKDWLPHSFRILYSSARAAQRNELRDSARRRAVDARQQLASLRARNLVLTERQGTTIRYEVSDPAIWRLLDAALEIFDNQLVSVRTTLEDLRREA